MRRQETLTLPRAHHPIPPLRGTCTATTRRAATTSAPCISLLKSQVIDVLLDHLQNLITLGDVLLNHLFSARFL